ncbi:Gfo/Idh/MocA family protein [Novosphingobium aerophilum]|uniref:Gfo/Idh/MocA family oxidoreductase n=1 Tax=Novosphingobium aerophilum TaxID=2839843 RepID=A0A7X1F4U8_9SPHN|nr:Gfo/Idh/MocA family oxidoreductase [Novosphingobium aerophilum]MBC2650410.1 Gfo/Idh/MocA family oxidoreductase [Novosphingobium aerophilum]
MLRVGIIGAAWGGFAHLPAWRSLPGVEVTAICTSRRETAEAAATRLGIARPFWDPAAMCADPEIDIVDCGTRPALRLPWVLAALDHGKHVYNSCPHAPDWAGARSIDARWRQSGSVGVVDAFSQYIPALRHMAALVADGFIGTILGGSCRFNLSLFNRPNPRFPYNWFADPEAGVSALRNHGSHLLHLLLPMLGPVAQVSARERQLLPRWTFPDGTAVQPGNTDHADALIAFASGVVIPMQVSWAMPLHSGFAIDLFGTAGRLLAESPTFPTSRECTLHGGALGEPLAPIAAPETFHRTPGVALDATAEVPPSFPMALTMQSLLAEIRGEGQAAPGFAAACEVERVLEALHRASASQSWVAVSDVA